MVYKYKYTVKLINNRGIMFKLSKYFILQVFLVLSFSLIAVSAVSAADNVSTNFTSNMANGSVSLSFQYDYASSNNESSWSGDFIDITTSTGQDHNAYSENHNDTYSENLNDTYTSCNYNVSATTGNDADPLTKCIFNDDEITDSMEQNPVHTNSNWTVILIESGSDDISSLTQIGYITGHDNTAPTMDVNPDGDECNSNQTGTISINHPDRKIYYTTDDSDPTDSSNGNRVPYSDPIPIVNMLTLEYAVVNNGGVWSSRYSKNYTVDAMAPAVNASVSGGTYNTAQTVTLSSNEVIAVIYYATDTTDPRTSGTRIEYTAPIILSNTTTLSFAAVDLEGNWSPVFTENYIINLVKPEIVSSDPANEAVNVSVNKTITVTFNEPIKWGNSWIEFKTSNGMSTAFSTFIRGNKLIIRPSSPLIGGKYHLLIHSGSVTDLVGNEVSSYLSVFTTLADLDLR